MSSRVILAHSPSANAQARAVAGQLTALGFDVALGAPRGKQAPASKVIVLWSARGTPALRAVARKAHANGNLVCVRLDSASPPVDAGGVHAVRLPRGRAQGAAWRKLLAAKTRAMRAEKPERAAAMRLPPCAVRRPVAALPYPASYAKRSDVKLGSFVAGLAAIALVVLAAGTEAYARDPQFAQRIAQLASSAQAQAAELLSAQR